MKRSKIICTLGPASQDKEILDQMIKAGMDVVRLNFSHGTPNWHKEIIHKLRRLSPRVSIMQDLQGPRLRVGKLPREGLEVHRGQEVTLGQRGNIPLAFNLVPYVHKGTRILIHDGLVEIKVIKIKKNLITSRVIRGNVIFSGKGINIPGIKLRSTVITKKDQADLKFGLKHGVDFVALSFVKDSRDIRQLKRLIGRRPVKIIAKIERKEALENFNEILEAADGIMVARGDLGVEISPAQVPLAQKEIIEKCLRLAKPVIVATQMLDSMIRSPRPTRAEVSDVANAVIDHTDALMLSGETAFGQYPLEAVKMMAHIIRTTEKSHFDDMSAHYFSFKRYTIRDSLSQSVFELVRENKAKAVIVNSLSGETARLIARHRPETKIITLTNDWQVIRQLQLSWGVVPLYLRFYRDLDNLIKNSLREVKRKKLVKTGDKVVIVAGQPTGKRSKMNLIKVQII